MTSLRIKAEAARWLIELDTAEDTETLWPAFEAWLQKDAEHRSAYARAERTWRTLEELRRLYAIGMPRTSMPGTAATTSASPPRRKALSSTVVMMAIAAAAAAALALLSYT